MREKEEGGVMVMEGGVTVAGVAGSSKSVEPSELELDHTPWFLWILRRIGGGPASDSSGDLTLFLDRVDIRVGWKTVESLVVVVVVVVVAVVVLVVVAVVVVVLAAGFIST